MQIIPLPNSYSIRYDTIYVDLITQLSLGPIDGSSGLYTGRYMANSVNSVSR